MALMYSRYIWHVPITAYTSNNISEDSFRVHQHFRTNHPSPTSGRCSPLLVTAAVNFRLGSHPQWVNNRPCFLYETASVPLSAFITFIFPIYARGTNRTSQNCGPISVRNPVKILRLVRFWSRPIANYPLVCISFVHTSCHHCSSF